MKYKEIETKYQDIINIAKEYMITIKDNEHNINHTTDVVFYTKELLEKLKLDVKIDVCIISAYWHDVGRIKGTKNHEKLSAEMLKETMTNLNYDEELINACFMAIENHKWNMHPQTIEGLIIKDADKLAWLGMGRWSSCLSSNQKLTELIELFPRLRNELLYFDESREIYDRDIVNLVKKLYYKIYE